MPDQIAMKSATELVALYRDGSLSPVDATQAALDRIERYNPDFNAFNLVDAEGALKAARESEERWRLDVPRGLLDGVPVSIKDILITKGWPTLRGSKTIDPDQNWNEDAPAVARLKEHGAVLLGKTTTPEFGWKGVTDSPLTGITRNPWNAERTPGGSSGGASAALAAGMGALAIGTDGGGSIRIPAAFTGIVGHKPSFGRVPAWPLSPFGTVAHVGPMARTVADTALMLTVMAEPDWRDWYALPNERADYTRVFDDDLSGLKIAFSPSLGGHPVHPDIADLVARAAERFTELGAVVEEADPDLNGCAPVFRTLWFAGAASILRMLDPEMLALVDPGLRAVAERGAADTLSDYQEATRQREAIGHAMNLFHQTYDLLLTPSLPITAFEAGKEYPSDDPEGRWVDWTPFSYPFNLTQQPAISVPCGLCKDGLPAGLQIVGPRYADGLVLRAAHAYESTATFPMPDLE